MFSLHLKATMMKVSDPIMFGHCVKAYFKARASDGGATAELQRWFFASTTVLGHRHGFHVMECLTLHPTRMFQDSWKNKNYQEADP